MVRGNAGQRGVEQVGQGRAGSEMWGVLLVPSSSPTLSPIYDGVDVNVTSNVTWFHLDHGMVSRRNLRINYPSTEGAPSHCSERHNNGGAVFKTMLASGE